MRKRHKIHQKNKIFTEGEARMANTYVKRSPASLEFKTGKPTLLNIHKSVRQKISSVSNIARR